MKKFILLYVGPATPMEQMTEEQGKKIMGQWDVWMRKVDGAMLDMGSPTADGHAVVDDGSSSDATELTGYSIIQAEDMDKALSLVQDHPFLSDKTGKFRVEVFELLPIPGM
jgi:hypothetical protein